MTPYKDIDEYIHTFPPPVQEILQQIRKLVHELAPDAIETINYGMPTFKLNGNLVHFAAYKNHIGFYPIPSGIDAFQKETLPYRAGKGTLQFPIDQPLPWELIKKIIQFRIEENLKKKEK